jgi:hypothetical protein
MVQKGVWYRHATFSKRTKWNKCTFRDYRFQNTHARGK